MTSDGKTEDQSAGDAARWFAKLNGASVSTEDLLCFRVWRLKPSNVAAYQEVERVWSGSGALAIDPDIANMTASALKKGRARSPNKQASWALALTCSVLASVAAFFLVRPLVFGETYKTATAETKTLSLADGSKVRLDTDSRVIVRLTPWRRSIILAGGRALFDIVHQVNRPLEVKAGDASVHDLGTRFQVERKGKGAEVTLLEGEVEVSRPRRAETPLALKPGDAWTSASEAPPHRVNLTSAVSWTTGALQFEDRPIAEVIADLNRYSPHKIVLDAPQVASTRVSGRFETAGTAAAAALAKLYDLGIRKAPDGDIVLTERVDRSTPDRDGEGRSAGLQP